MGAWIKDRKMRADNALAWGISGGFALSLHFYLKWKLEIILQQRSKRKRAVRLANERKRNGLRSRVVN